MGYCRITSLLLTLTSLLLLELCAASKKLPIGVTKIRDILEKDHVYVDKTGYLLKLIQNGPRYAIVTRPAKFGKSLLLSTLAEIFNGNKELFKGTKIYRSEYQWKKHSVLYLDFGEFNNGRPKNFQNDLLMELFRLAELHSVVVAEIFRSSVPLFLENLIKALNDVVILVDNYDTAIIDNLKVPDTAEEFRKSIVSFFEHLQSYGVQYTYITGVYKFSLTTLTNGKIDITNLLKYPEYTEIMGYTEEELDANFKCHIQNIAQQKTRQQGGSVSQKDISDEMRTWYYGYRFSPEGQSLYNPHSVVRYLKEGKTGNYSIETRNAGALFDAGSALAHNGTFTAKWTLEDPLHVERIHPKTLMIHNGFLTIKGKDLHPTREAHEVNFPNREVESVVCKAALRASLKPNLQDEKEKMQVKRFLTRLNLDKFLQTINIGLQEVYRAFEYADESFFLEFFQTKLKDSGVTVQLLPDGVKAESEKMFFVFGITLDRTPKEALVKTETHKKEAQDQKKELLCMGINYFSDVPKYNWYCNWEANLYSVNGTWKKWLTQMKKN